MSETYWPPLSSLVSKPEERRLWNKLDEQMRRVIEAFRIRRVQRVPYHFFEEDLGASTSVANVPVLGTTNVNYYIIPRNAHVIEVTIMVNANITSDGWRFNIELNGTALSDDIEITASAKTQIGSTSYYYVSQRFDYGTRNATKIIDEYSILGVSYRATLATVTPTTADALVTVLVAHTGED